MPPTSENWDRNSVWAPYAPDEKTPWNLRRVVHLHRRAAFGATWGELQRDLREGPAASVERLLAGSARAAGVAESFEDFAQTLAETAVLPHPRPRIGAERLDPAGPEGPARLKGWRAWCSPCWKAAAFPTKKPAAFAASLTPPRKTAGDLWKPLLPGIRAMTSSAIAWRH